MINEVKNNRFSLEYRIVKSDSKLWWIYILVRCLSLLSFWNYLLTCHDTEYCQPAKMMNQSEKEKIWVFHPQNRSLTQSERLIQSARQLLKIHVSITKCRCLLCWNNHAIGNNASAESCKPAPLAAKFKARGKIVLWLIIQEILPDIS